MAEIFKDIPGYEGLYQASNLGNIRSLTRIHPHPWAEGKNKIYGGKILFPTKNKAGYLRLSLYNSGKSKSFFVARLVASAFLGLDLSDKNIICDHIDRNTLNNEETNLRIATVSQNAMNKIKCKSNLFSSKYKGVSLDKRECLKKRWKAQIMLNGKSKKLGYFYTEIEAANIYNKYAEYLFGAFSLINII